MKQSIIIEGVEISEGDIILCDTACGKQELKVITSEPWYPILQWFAYNEKANCKYRILEETPTRTPYFGLRPCDWELVK